MRERVRGRRQVMERRDKERNEREREKEALNALIEESEESGSGIFCGKF
jgi:hypothetical protein